jgi:hypothetical protein
MLPDPDDRPATLVFEGEEKMYLQQMASSAVMKFLDFRKGDPVLPVLRSSIAEFTY